MAAELSNPITCWFQLHLEEFALPNVSLFLIVTWELGGGLFLMISPPWRGEGWEQCADKQIHTHILFCIPHISYTNSAHIPSLSPVAWKNRHPHMASIIQLCLKVSADSAFFTSTHTQTWLHLSVLYSKILWTTQSWSTDHSFRNPGISHHILVLLFVSSFTSSAKNTVLQSLRVTLCVSVCVQW